MPLRYTPTGAALHHHPHHVLFACHRAAAIRDRRFFHATLRLRFDSGGGSSSNTSSDSSAANHYEILNVHPDASLAEIKKCAYPPPSHPSIVTPSSRLSSPTHP